MTHYLPVFTEVVHREHQRAACGAWITFREHATEPTCEQCAAWLRADCFEAAVLVQQWTDDRQPAL